MPVLRYLVILHICTAFFPALALAPTLVNVSIDDTYGDERSGAPPVYEPSDGWAPGQTCSTCGMASFINASEPFDGSWHDTTWHPSSQGVVSVPLNITLSFTGVAIYAFCLLANNAGYVTTYTGIDFLLDGQAAGTFTHSPNETTAAIQYNTSVFSRSSLSNTLHTLTLVVNGGNQAALMLFDYAVYTAVQDDSNSTGVATTTATVTGTGASQTTSRSAPSTAVSRASLSPGAISGIVVGTLFALVAVVIGVVLLRMRRRSVRQDKRHSHYPPQQMLEHTGLQTMPFSYDGPGGERQTISTQGKADSSTSGSRTQDTLRAEVSALRREMERMRADDAESQERRDTLMELAAFGLRGASGMHSSRAPSTILPAYVEENSSDSESRARETENSGGLTA